jgi:outer membrane protein TolC
VLRLNPEAVVVPLEPDFLQVSLIAPTATLDELIPVGLRNRPELASHRAVVEATLARLKQERMRPLIPSLLVTGNGTPDFFFQGGVFGTGSPGLNQWSGRSDVAMQVVWQAENLGFGNQSLIRKRQGEMQLATVELFQVQDRVAAEVTQAKAELQAATERAAEAERGLKGSLATYKGNLRGLGQTTRFGDLLTLVNRPQEVVAALSQLQQAYLNYYRTTADYNRAQFRLYYALGFPSQILACQNPPGVIEPVDGTRPCYLPPVQHCPPCNYCR